MTFEQAVRAHEQFLAATDRSEVDARAALLAFLQWDDVDEEAFGLDVRIVLASADFSKELVTSVLWMNSRGIDIRCIRMRPYEVGGKLVVDIQQLIPLPEAQDYEIRIREKTEKTRQSKTGGPDFTQYDLTVDGVKFTRLWKRRLILQLIRELSEKHGVTPERLRAICPPFNRLFASVEGVWTSEEEFVEAATKEYELRNQMFVERRFFTESDELFHDGGKTYALTNQWGVHWGEAVGAIRDAYPDVAIDYPPLGVSLPLLATPSDVSSWRFLGILAPATSAAIDPTSCSSHGGC